MASHLPLVCGCLQSASSLIPSAELIQQKELEKMKLEEEVAGLKRCGLGGRRFI